MTQDEINAYVISLADTGITPAHMIAMKDLLDALATAQVTPANIGTMLERAELSLLASVAALAIQQHDETTAQIETDRAAMRASLVQALTSAQAAFVETSGG